VIAIATALSAYTTTGGEPLLSSEGDQFGVVSGSPTERCDSSGYSLKQCIYVIVTNEVGVRLPINQPPIDVKFPEPVDVRGARPIIEPATPGSSTFDPLYVENSILNPLWVRVAP
jgi:hypothetical protein